MFGLFDKITEFFQEIFIGIIQANLEAMFLDINDKVSLVATEVGKTPQGWNAEIGNKDFELDVLEEAYTTEHWLVRIYKDRKSTRLNSSH